jgi:hypothetical protein
VVLGWTHREGRGRGRGRGRDEGREVEEGKEKLSSAVESPANPEGRCEDAE